MSGCKCKVGRCGTCGSSCKRCGCACDGLTPEQKLSRKRGQHGKLKKPIPKKAKRQASEAVAAAISNMEREDEQVDDTLRYSSEYVPLHCADATMEDLVHCYGKDLNNWRKVKPTEKQSNGGEALRANSRSRIVALACEAAENVVRIMAPGHTSSLLPEIGKKLLAKFVQPEDDKGALRLKNNCLKVLQSAPRASLQGRVVRAVLTKSLKAPEINRIKAGLREEDPENKLALYPTGKERLEAVADFETMVKGEKLEDMTRNQQNFDPEAASFAVECVLAARNVGILSWGTRPVELGVNNEGRPEIHRLPALMRRKPMKDLYDDYVAQCRNKGWKNEMILDLPPGTKKKQHKTLSRRILCESTFRKIVLALTGGDMKLLQAVDYVVGMLVNDPCEKLQRLIDFFALGQEKEVLTHRLTLVRNFLKVQYDDHARHEDDDVATHGIKYGLAKPGQLPEVDQRLKRGRCNGCMTVPHFCTRLRWAIEERRSDFDDDTCNDALEVVHDQEKKFELYMAHRLRVINQQKAINAHLKALEEYTIRTKKRSAGYAVLDWKMKFEPISARETSTEHFGKRGIGWHGFLIHYYEWDETENRAVKRTIYMDQIMSGANKQDAMAVGSMLEAFLWQVSKEMPWLETVTIQSDNASCYQSKQLLALIPVFNSRFTVKVTRYIHTETQDGKGLIDAHFARGTCHLTNYLKVQESNKIARIATPNGLARALASRGGINNSCVQLVRVDRQQLGELESILEPMGSDAKTFFSRYCEIEFIEPTEGWRDWGPSREVSPLEALKSFKALVKARIWAYSGVGDGVEFTLDYGRETRVQNRTVVGTFRPTSHQENAPSTVNETPSVATSVEMEDDDAEGSDSFQDDNSSGSQPSIEEVLDETVVRYKVNTDERQAEEAFTGVAVLRHSLFEDMTRTSRRKKSRIEAYAELEKVVCPRRDIEAFAVRKAGELILAHESAIRVRDYRSDMPEYQESAIEPLKEFPLGWARRQDHGDSYGVSYVGNYKEDIRQFFEQGREESTRQMNASMMLEALQKKYPNRFSLPGEIEIRKEINSLFSSQKGREKTAKKRLEAGRDPTSGNRFSWPEHHTERLTKLLCMHSNATVAEIASAFVEQVRRPDGSLPDDLPQEKENKNGTTTTQLQRIKTKISAIKATQAKQDLQRNTL